MEEIALTALPGEFLLTDSHVFRKGTLGTVVVLLNDKILEDTKDDAGSTEKDGNLDPGPQFGPFFGMRFVGVGCHDFFLVGNTGADLGNGLLFHLLFSTQPRNGNDRSAGSLLAASGHGGDRASAGEALGEISYERLE